MRFILNLIKKDNVNIICVVPYMYLNKVNDMWKARELALYWMKVYFMNKSDTVLADYEMNFKDVRPEEWNTDSLRVMKGNKNYKVRMVLRDKYEDKALVKDVASEKSAYSEVMKSLKEKGYKEEEVLMFMYQIK